MRDHPDPAVYRAAGGVRHAFDLDAHPRYADGLYAPGLRWPARSPSRVFYDGKEWLFVRDDAGRGGSEYAFYEAPFERNAGGEEGIRVEVHSNEADPRTAHQAHRRRAMREVWTVVPVLSGQRGLRSGNRSYLARRDGVLAEQRRRR